MRYTLLALLSAVLLGTSLLAADKVVKVEREWNPSSNRKADDNKYKKAPKDGVIATQRALVELWESWGDRPPRVDFDKYILLVAAGQGPNIIKVEPLKLSDKGDLTFRWSITERGGPGYVSTMLQVKRAGIKTVNGKPLPKE